MSTTAGSTSRTSKTPDSGDTGKRILVGTCSWTDPTILKSGWYPPEAKTAEQRLEYYASQFPIVEVDSSYYALPSERNSLLWVERTPPEFTFNFKAFALLTGHGTEPKRLPVELRDSLPKGFAGGQKQVYMKDLPPAALRWIWDAFVRALWPLKETNKLGAVLFQFPPCFHLSRQSRRYVEECREAVPDLQLAVEFRHASWLDEHNRQETFALLRANKLAYVCVDEPQGFHSSVPPAVEVTNPELAVVRFHGRNAENWEARHVSVAERFKYLYDERELAGWAPKVQELAGQAEQVHALFNNCYSDYGVRNAATLADLLEVRRPPA